MATVYPFDPSGTSTANRIINEQHVVTAQNFRDYHYVIPKFAPFFEANFSIRLQYPNGTVRNLTLGVDYYFANQFLDASRACAKPVYGAISFLDTDTAGILSISYNTVGGMWNITAAEITRILAEEMRNPRTTTWEQITNLPQRFPVIDHEWDLVDMVGASSVVTAIDDVRDAILSANGGGLNDHINNYSNPHSTTKAQVGLGNVLDYAIASTLQAQDGTSNSFYMTPLRTRDAISAIGGALVNAHANDKNNPHATTKAHVGLGNVQDYAVATKLQAEGGVMNDRYMTPLRTAEAITALVGTAFTAHAANKLNPHEVTKDQVGLFNVENYSIATAEEARLGTSNSRYMTPLRTTQLVMEYVTTQLDGHQTRRDNPHEVTKGQVGLANVENFGIATILESQEGSSNTAYMTPGRTADAINALAAPKSHLLNMNNPHEVSAEQVGAYTKFQTDELLGQLVRMDADWVAGQTSAAFKADVVIETLERTKEQFASAAALYSLDKLTTVDPISNPYRWILLGTVSSLNSADTLAENAIDVTHPSVYWFLSGGHKQESTAAANALAASPSYLVHAKNGLSADKHTVDVTRLSGNSDSDLKFGYTYNSDTSILNIWLRVSYGYNDIQATSMSLRANDIELLDGGIVVEPTGITYVQPISYATVSAVSDLAARVQALEETVSSIAVV